jgi:hypothetical protein
MLYPVQLPLSTDAPKLATLTRPNATFWELELHAGPHNTLTTFVIMECLMKAFDIVKKDWRDTGGMDARVINQEPSSLLGRVQIGTNISPEVCHPFSVSTLRVLHLRWCNKPGSGGI